MLFPLWNIIIITIIIISGRNSTSTEFDGPMFIFLLYLSLYITATLTSCVLQRFNPAVFERNVM